MGSKRDSKSEKDEKQVKGSGAASEKQPSDKSTKKHTNPPRTTTHGWLTTPKFGSSTSGGGEIEPGPERD